MRVEIWADVVCPWCYLGKRRFEQALEGFEHRDEVEVTYRAFQLDPQAETMDRTEMLVSKFGVTPERAVQLNEEMEQRAAEAGLEYNLDGTVVGNTLDAHRLVHLASELGLQEAFVEALYKAHFTDKRSLFDHDSLTKVAVEAGLDEAAVRKVLESDEYADAVLAEQSAAQDLGATGVPFFVFDRRYGVAGAQATETFSEVLAKAYAG
ncbi:DsbA family oxidoreductase [Actinomadura barringtoniae]|uniref:DsbA family oxidoreductase n=1 Tax=Actinomadura barringtoniae TaxID=1427535 RepID=A0A939PMZ6_9ACTN|nr:DsbA family oxidoreductase [Actinomadura barringtoniae]MBO2455610.1 DsbA family oxidoreductase [Actinomadura barringtoniae]